MEKEKSPALVRLALILRMALLEWMRECFLAWVCYCDQDHLEPESVFL